MQAPDDCRDAVNRVYTVLASNTDTPRPKYLFSVLDSRDPVTVTDHHIFCSPSVVNRTALAKARDDESNCEVTELAMQLC